MRYIRKKFPRRYRGGGKKRRWAVWLVLAVIVIAVFCERAISGVSPELIEEAARGYVLECISEAVDAEMEEDKGPFVNVEKGSEGQVSLVSADQERPKVSMALRAAMASS